MPIFSASEIALLRKNRPSLQEDHSTISHLLNPWWEWVTKRVPENIAPNTLTVAGSLAMVIPTLLQLYISPTLDAAQPWWICVMAILGIFLFQTLDAIDGKQARRTKTSSPLGSWLDHALDILTIQFVFVGTAASMGLGVNLTLSFLVGTVLLNNYMLHWEVHHTKLLYLGNGTSIAEAQVMCMGIHLVSALFGTSFWQQASPVLAFSYGDLVVLIAVVLVGWSGMFFGFLRAKASGIRVSSLLQMRGQVYLVLILAIAMATIEDKTVLCLYVLSICLLGSRLISELVLHNLIDRQPVIIQWPVGVLCIFMSSIFLFPMFKLGQDAMLLCAACCLAFCMMTTLWRMSSIARKVSRVLEIKIFSIP